MESEELMAFLAYVEEVRTRVPNLTKRAPMEDLKSWSSGGWLQQPRNPLFHSVQRMFPMYLYDVPM